MHIQTVPTCGPASRRISTTLVTITNCNAELIWYFWPPWSRRGRSQAGRDTNRASVQKHRDLRLSHCCDHLGRGGHDDLGCITIARIALQPFLFGIIGAVQGRYGSIKTFQGLYSLRKQVQQLAELRHEGREQIWFRSRPFLEPRQATSTQEIMSMVLGVSASQRTLDSHRGARSGQARMCTFPVLAHGIFDDKL